MNITAMLGAGALAIGSLVFTAAPAEAQRHDQRGHDRGHQDRDQRHGQDRYDRGHQNRDQHYGQRRYDRGHYNRGGHYGQRDHRRGYAYRYRSHVRSRVVCRVQRGYYGPVRRCYRVYR
ncbi:MAG: hypothetical protein M3R64_05940 [Pseudomonadota bacterium]|nr:hypothetical protein [Pseudomonadota bacterium]